MTDEWSAGWAGVPSAQRDVQRRSRDLATIIDAALAIELVR